LSSVDGEGGGQPQDKGSLDFLADEIRALGIDPMILLPITRVDELSAMISDGQGDSARELVRRLAPAATRKLSRRLLEEPRMRRSVMDFLARYQTGVETAIRRDRTGIRFSPSATLPTPLMGPWRCNSLYTARSIRVLRWIRLSDDFTPAIAPIWSSTSSKAAVLDSAS
jgi:hypothetical protein